MRSEIAREKLLNLKEYRTSLQRLERTTFEPNGLLRLALRLPLGYYCRLYLAREWGSDPGELLFRSHGGNLDLYGAVNFIQLKGGTTEVHLTLEYRFTSLVYAWYDRWQHVLENYIDQQVAAIEDHFARPVPGIRADRNLPSPMNGHHKDEAA